MPGGAFIPHVNAYRWYEDDGGEAASTAIAAQDTAITRDDEVSPTLHLRARIDETGGAGGGVNDDYGLEYEVNSSGAWVAVTASSSRIRSHTASQLTDGAATTNRATEGISDPGSGSFAAGEQEAANGVIEDHQLPANDFTEHVWALELVAADNAEGDVIKFRIAKNAGTPGMTNNVTPQITIDRASVSAACKAPGTVESVNDADVPLDAIAWSNPQNAAADDDVRTTCAMTSFDPGSEKLRCLKFGHTFPIEATLEGIEVKIEGGTGAGDPSNWSQVQLQHGGGSVGDDKATGDMPSSYTAVTTFGGPTDDWNAGLTLNNIEDGSFGVGIQCGVGSPPGSPTPEIDYVEICVYYAEPGGGGGGGGGETLCKRWRWRLEGLRKHNMNRCLPW